MDFQTVQSEKAKAIARFNRLRAVSAFWHFLEVAVAVFVLFWSSSVAGIVGKSVVKLFGYAYAPLLSFVLFNSIIAALVLLNREEREGEGEAVPGMAVFDESDFDIPPKEDVKTVCCSGSEGKSEFPAEEDRETVGFSEIGGKLDFPLKEDQNMVGFSEIGEKIDFFAKEDRKLVGYSEIGEKIDFFAKEDRKMVGFFETGEKMVGLSETGEKMAGFSETGEKTDFPSKEDRKTMVFWEIGEKTDFPATRDQKTVFFSETSQKIDFPAIVPPCAAAAEAAVEAARRRIRKFERTQSAKLRHDMERGVPCQHQLRRSETEKAISVIEKVDTLSNEEFRRTIDEFIAKQQRFLLEQKKAEKGLLVDN